MLGRTLYGAINVVVTWIGPISNTLTNELVEWVNRYGEWIDWDDDKLLPNGIGLEEEHNKQGLNLTGKIKKELEGKYRIKFSPSTMARMYANKNH